MVETDQFIISLVLPECLSVKICCSTLSENEANRDGSDAESSFRCFSLFLPRLRTLAQEKRSENCLRFGTSGPSLCLYSFLSRNIILFPALTMAARAKKRNSGEGWFTLRHKHKHKHKHKKGMCEHKHNYL